ncbi:MAG: DNA-3-methyladenine glycosylase 2 family protein [Clostridia bacterium]|nr:DNA-3-methyladenine glycosylase 2 family protein [Clostridia bacterium]
MPIYEYGRTEIDRLKRQDPVLGELIDRLGPLQREVGTDRFGTLVDSIVSQQISGKAAESVLARLDGLPGGRSPDALTAAPIDVLRACGLSARKAGWLQGLAHEVASGRLDLAGLDALEDGEIVGRLAALPGIGVWTAEMFLIFSMRRPDVVSWGDFGIRRGMERLYGYDRITRENFRRHRKDYSPYGTVASLYLWAVPQGWKP